MARVTLELPTSFQFVTDITVDIGHINYGGHLGNDSALTLLHEVRLRFVRSLGLNELDIEGRGMIITDAVVVYKAEAFWGDLLEAELACVDFNKYGCDIFYRLRRKTDDRDILHAKTGILFFNYETRKPASIPAAFSAALLARETQPI
jgi:4-hydroxybenzoyl-CoA thioesterase